MKGKILHDKIKERRIEIDFRQTDLAEASGVNVNIIKGLETGLRNTSYENIVEIANALKIDVSEIFIEGYRDTKIIAAVNNKGGCGKTSVVSSLAYTLSQMDNKVLLIDSDQQMNLSIVYGLDENKEKNINIAIEKEEGLFKHIINTKYENIDFVLGDYNMSTIEMTLFTKKLRESIFKKILSPIIERGIYDYILVDTNPTLGMLNFNILNTCDYIIVPVEMSYLGIKGMTPLLRFIADVRETNPNLQIAGVLMNKVDKREKITDKAEAMLKDIFGDIIFDSYIPIDSNIKKSQWENLPVEIFDKNSRASKKYKALAKELTKIVRR